MQISMFSSAEPPASPSASQVIEQVAQSHDLQKIVMVGTAASRFAVHAIAPQLHERLLVVHGELDDTVASQSVMDWARPQTIPVTVVPGGGHFFHGSVAFLVKGTNNHGSA